MADLVLASATQTATGVVGTAADVSAFTDDFTLEVVVSSMTAGIARIAIEDSVDGTTYVALTTFIVSGADLTSDRTFKLRSYNVPGAVIGVTSARMRVNITKLTASTITVSATLKDV